MLAQRKVWAVLIGAPTAVELIALATGHHEWTLSPQLRWALRLASGVANVGGSVPAVAVTRNAAHAATPTRDSATSCPSC